MGDLYINLYSLDSDVGETDLEGATCLLVLHFLGSPASLRVHLRLLEGPQPPTTPISAGLITLRLNLAHLSDYQIVSEVPEPASFCQLPVFSSQDGISCVAGLAAVLRQVVKISDEQWQKLLGFRDACLVACAEFSMWTKFCEVDLLEGCRGVLGRRSGADSWLPTCLARLEAHLRQPIRTHNIGKLKDTQHTFVEGPHFLLSDLLIAIPVHIIVHILNISQATHLLPLTLKWLDLVKREGRLEEVLNSLCLNEVERESERKYYLPLVKNESLYKSDPRRYKPRHKLFTQVKDIEVGLKKASAVRLLEFQPAIQSSLSEEDIVPPDVPQQRLDRKIQQLFNLTRAALHVSKKGDTIVDFCSGSGHLGLILADSLPQSTVILLDNKEKSLDRARQKIKQLELRNVYVVQANLDYFTADFQVGVTLHACGVASDLVVQKCLQKKANFVVCPCCYGGIQSNHIVGYPQSRELKEAGISEKEYVVLGHCADQARTEQGEKAMQIIDTDRSLAATNLGYSVSLYKLEPPSCTTRNNLIVATIR